MVVCNSRKHTWRTMLPLGVFCTLLFSVCWSSENTPREPLVLDSFDYVGDFRLDSPGDVSIRGAISVRGTLEIHARNIEVSGSINVSGNVSGGHIALLPSADLSLTDSAILNIHATNSGGQIFLGGDYQGRGALPHAARVLVAPGAAIRADACDSGNGGRVIVWSDQMTRFRGTISARGGREAGDGGFVEISSKNELDFAGHVDTGALNGANGTLLLDPNTIDIVGALPDLNGDGTTGDDIATATDLSNSANFPGKTSVITVGALKTVLA